MSEQREYIALMGNPNSGKTAIFNLLTGMNLKVSNYPGITVDMRRGTARISNDKTIEIMDLPGTYSLTPESMDEKIAFSETGNPLNSNKPPKEPNTKSVRTSKWKLVINEYNDTKELYDLENDPDEKNNVIGKYVDVEQTLWDEFLQIQKKCNT